MRDKPITHANLRLAHLLLKRTVTNLVVTPDFDDFLTRSLDLFGRRHVVCDHPRTAERQPGVSRRQIRGLAGLDFMARAENIVFIGDTAVGRTGLATGLRLRALQDGYRGLFLKAQASSTKWDT